MYDDVTWAWRLIEEQARARLRRGGKLKVDDELRAYVTYMYDDVTWETPLIRLTSCRLWRGGKWTMNCVFLLWTSNTLLPCAPSRSSCAPTTTDFKQAMSDLFDRHAAEEKRFRALQERVKALQAD